MAKQVVNEKEIVDYLLGNLPENEMERFDEMSVTDEVFTERLRAVENDLIDSFVKGELSGETLKNLQLQYLSSPRRREKILFAKTLAKVLDSSPIQQEQSRFAEFRSATPVKASRIFQWAVAAVLFLACGYLIFENLNLRNQIQNTVTDQQSLKQREQELLRQIAQQQASDSQTKNELARVQQRLAELEQQLGSSSQKNVKLIAMILPPQTRSARKTPILNIPDGNVVVLFTLELEADDFPAYHVALKNPATGEVLWQSAKLRSDKAKNSVQFRIPAAVLKTQNYFLELYGILNGGTNEIVSSYPFGVKRLD